jgi:hypothetical protein
MSSNIELIVDNLPDINEVAYVLDYEAFEAHMADEINKLIDGTRVVANSTKLDGSTKEEVITLAQTDILSGSLQVGDSARVQGSDKDELITLAQSSLIDGTQMVGNSAKLDGATKSQLITLAQSDLISGNISVGNSAKLEGSTKVEIINESHTPLIDGTQMVGNSAKLEGLTKAEIVDEARSDIVDGTLTVANSQNLEGSSKEELKSETLKEVAGYKNQIINGDFRVHQRLASSNPSSGEYLIDRWIYTKNGSGESVEVTNGYDSTIKSKYLKINQSVASSGASVREIAQRVEDCSRFDGVVVTLSFYIKGTIGKTITPILKQRNGDSATLNTYNGASITLNGTWQKVTKSFELSDISDTLTQVDTSYLNVALSLPLDEIYEVSISQVQLEYSEVATEFEKRDYTLEETMCKRYYREEQVTVSAIHDEGYSLNSGSLQFDVGMRVVPSVSVESFMVLGHSIGSVDYVYPTQRGMHWDIISTNVAYRPFGVRHQIKYKASAEL